MSTPTLLTGSAGLAAEVNVKRRTARVIANDDTLDRHGTVIQPRGIGLDSYRRHEGGPIFDHGHDPNRGAHARRPMARSSWARTRARTP